MHNNPTGFTNSFAMNNSPRNDQQNNATSSYYPTSTHPQPPTAPQTGILQSTPQQNTQLNIQTHTNTHTHPSLNTQSTSNQHTSMNQGNYTNYMSQSQTPSFHPMNHNPNMSIPTTTTNPYHNPPTQYASNTINTNINTNINNNNNMDNQSYHTTASMSKNDNIETLFPKAQSMISHLNSQLTGLEMNRVSLNQNTNTQSYTSYNSNKNNNPDANISPEQIDKILELAQSIRNDLQILQETIGTLTRLSHQQNPQLLTFWTARILNLRRQADDIRISTSKYVDKLEKQRVDRIRSNLFEGASMKDDPLFTNDDDADLETGAISQKHNALMQRENDGLITANRALDRMLETAQSSVESLFRQRNSLKNIQRRMMDVANSLGLSQHILRLIDRKQSMNNVVVYGGMIFTIAIILFVWYMWNF